MAKIPDRFDFTIVKGDDALVKFKFLNVDANGTETDIDLTGYTVLFSAKRQKTDSTKVIDFSTADATSFLLFDATGGEVHFQPSSVVTAAFTFTSLLYDITAISGGSPTKTTTIIMGVLTLDQGIT